MRFIWFYCSHFADDCLYLIGCDQILSLCHELANSTNVGRAYPSLNPNFLPFSHAQHAIRSTLNAQQLFAIFLCFPPEYNLLGSHGKRRCRYISFSTCTTLRSLACIPEYLMPVLDSYVCTIHPVLVLLLGLSSTSGLLLSFNHVLFSYGTSDLVLQVHTFPEDSALSGPIWMTDFTLASWSFSVVTESPY